MTAIRAYREAQAALTAARDRRRVAENRKLTTGYEADHEAYRVACVRVRQAQDAFDLARESYLVDRALRDEY